MSKIKNQIRSLYTSSILGNLSLTGTWVAILADDALQVRTTHGFSACSLQNSGLR